MSDVSLAADSLPAVMLVVGCAGANDVTNLSGYERESTALGSNLLTNESDVGVRLKCALERDVTGSATHQPHEMVVLSRRQSIGM